MPGSTAPITPIGLDCVLYRNTGSYSSPVWNLIDAVVDVTVPLSKGEAETSTRGSKWKTRRGTLKDASIDFNMRRRTDTAGQADFDALLDSFINGTPVELLVLDGPIGTSGSQGLRATCEIFKFDNGQPIEGAVTIDVSAKPTPAANDPAWFTSTGS